MELPSIPPENIEIEEEIEPTRESWSGEMERQEEVELGENEDGEMVFESRESWKEENTDEGENKGDKAMSPEENDGKMVFKSGERREEEKKQETRVLFWFLLLFIPNDDKQNFPFSKL